MASGRPDQRAAWQLSTLTVSATCAAAGAARAASISPRRSKARCAVEGMGLGMSGRAAVAAPTGAAAGAASGGGGDHRPNKAGVASSHTCGLRMLRCSFLSLVCRAARLAGRWRGGRAREPRAGGSSQLGSQAANWRRPTSDAINGSGAAGSGLLAAVCACSYPTTLTRLE